MTYRQYSAELAQTMARLSASGASRSLSPEDLDHAVLGRRETLALLRTIVSGATRRELGPGHLSAGTTGTVALLHNPVLAFQRALSDYPAPRAEGSLSTLAGAPSASIAGSRWTAIARAAVLAAHDFTTQLPRLEPAHRWAVMADAAAIGNVLVALDAELLHAARSLPTTDPSLLTALERTQHSVLPIAAHEVSVLARSGELRDLDILTRPPVTRRPVRVSSPHSALEAQTRLPLQLRHAGELSPEVVGLTTVGQARILLAARRILDNTDPSRAQHARHLVEPLRTIGHEPHLAALMPSDTAPLDQTRELLRYVEGKVQVGYPSTAVSQMAAGLVERAPSVLRAARDAAREQLRSARWLVPYGDPTQPGELMWRRFDDATDSAPRLINALDAVAARAGHSLQEQVQGSKQRIWYVNPTPTHVRSTEPMAHETLAGLTRAPARPTSPEQPRPRGPAI